MKNTLNFFAIAILITLSTVSCKKKSVNEDIATLPYASETVPQGKSNLESAGKQMVSELSSLADVKGITASQSISNCLDLSNPFASPSQSASVFAAVKTSSNYGTSKDVNSMVNFLTTSLQSTSDSTLKQIFTKNKGVYTWNSSSKTWGKPTPSDKIEMLFPSTKTGTTNDAKLDLTYESKTATSSLSGINGDLPLSFDAVLTINTDKVLEYSFTAQYDNSGIPTNVSTFIALYPFKFEVTADKSSSSASLRYLFTDGTKTVFDLYAAVNGNLSQSSIDSNNPQDVISNSNAYVQVFNIKLAEKVDVKTLSQKYVDIYSNTTTTPKEKADASVVALNTYSALVLMYADTKQKIAQAQYYSKPSVNMYPTSYSIEINFIFEDGKPTSLETYFGAGFQSVVTDFNSLLTKLNIDKKL